MYLFLLMHWPNSLAVGSISRPVTDRFYVSRAKLACVLDSTAAANVCRDAQSFQLGARIMTIIGGILVSHGITDYSPLGAYLRLVPMNFYAIFALLMCICGSVVSNGYWPDASS
ncbi:hypothetical protein ACT691_02765 [Vibrio metschnikovii]